MERKPRHRKPRSHQVTKDAACAGPNPCIVRAAAMTDAIPQSAQERHAELCAIIAKHDHQYYVLNAPSIDDAEYDALFTELKRLEAKHPALITPQSPTQRVGEQPREQVEKASHAVPMYSLDNTYNEEELREFDRRVRDGLSSSAVIEYVAEPKLDGASLEIVYENGLLTRGITRGNGKVGEDVTTNVRTIRGLPLRIADTRPLSLRAEVVIFRSDLAQVNQLREQRGEDAFANPRNAAAGSLRLLDARQTAERPLRVYLYELAERHFATHAQALESLAELGLPTHNQHTVCASIDEVLTFIKSFDRDRHNLPYDTDGVVVKVNALSQRDILGTTSRFPRWAIAYKYAAERARTQVVAITGDVGRTGAITPVAVLTPVSLSGTTVSRAAMHNVDYVQEKDVRVHDYVWIQKAGEIIPQVLSVDRAARPDNTAAWAIPESCPACGSPVARLDGEAALRCRNAACPGRLKAALFYFTRRSAMDIDHLGKVLVETLVDRELVHDLADLFALPTRRDDLLALPRMAEKSVDNVLKAVEEAREQRTLAQLLTGLGIPLVGGVAAQIVAETFHDLASLLHTDPEEIRTRLADIHGIGPKIADSVGAFFDDPEKRQLCEKLLALGVRAQQPEAAAPVSGPLSGQSFCVTGVLSQPRAAVHAAISAAGGEIHDRVKKGTTYLVAGEKVGASKLTAAKKHGAQVIDEPALQAMLEAN